MKFKFQNLHMFICICILFPVFNRVCLVITQDDDLSVFSQ